MQFITRALCLPRLLILMLPAGPPHWQLNRRNKETATEWRQNQNARRMGTNEFILCTTLQLQSHIRTTPTPVTTSTVYIKYRCFRWRATQSLPSLPFPSLLTYLPTYSGIHGGGGHRSQVVVVAAAAVGRSGGGGGGDGTHRIVSADPLAFLSCMLGKDQIPESAASSSSAWNCTTVVGGGAP